MDKGKLIIIGAASVLVLFLGFVGVSFFMGGQTSTPAATGPVVQQPRSSVNTSQSSSSESQASSSSESTSQEEQSSASSEDQASEQGQSSANSSQPSPEALEAFKSALQAASGMTEQVEIAKNTPVDQLTPDQRQLLGTVPKEELTEEQQIALYGDPNMPNGPTATPEKIEAYLKEKEAQKQAQQQQSAEQQPQENVEQPAAPADQLPIGQNVFE